MSKTDTLDLVKPTFWIWWLWHFGFFSLMSFFLSNPTKIIWDCPGSSGIVQGVRDCPGSSGIVRNCPVLSGMVQDGPGSFGMVSLISFSYSMPVFSANSFGLFIWIIIKKYYKGYYYYKCDLSPQFLKIKTWLYCL